jgi:hypothetical protein
MEKSIGAIAPPAKDTISVERLCGLPHGRADLVSPRFLK